MQLPIKLGILLPILVVFVALRLLRANLFLWILAWTASLYVFFAYGFVSPIPGSAVTMYMAIAAVSLAAYVMSAPERTESFLRPLVRLAVERRWRPVLALLLLAGPVFAAWHTYRTLQEPVEPPFFARTIHPQPPAEITVHGTKIDLIRADNPFRKLEETDPEAFAQHVANGRRVYYENCFFCHGDGLAGDGLFARGLNPVPTNFTDAGVLPNFREAFFFWRVSKGGPGMPEEGEPWASAMPAWEKFLSEEEMWDVILFLYEFTGYPPRAIVEEHLAE